MTWQAYARVIVVYLAVALSVVFAIRVWGDGLLVTLLLLNGGLSALAALPWWPRAVKRLLRLLCGALSRSPAQCYPCWRPSC